MPPWADFEPFIVSGLALGGVYALSGARPLTMNGSKSAQGGITEPARS